MNKTFIIKLNTEVTIDFTSWGLSDAEQRGGKETRKLVMKHFMDAYGIDQFEIVEKNGNSLFEAMAEVVRVENNYLLTHKNEF